MWFLLTLIGYLLAAIVAILDKFILTKSVRSPVVYTFYSTIFAFGLFVFVPFLGETMLPYDLLLAMISGLAFGFGMWAMFAAMKEGEASHLAPFGGAILMTAVALFSYTFLGERLSPVASIGIACLAIASLLLSYQKMRGDKTGYGSLLWIAASAALFALSHVSAKYLYGEYSFATALVWSKGSVGLVGLFTLCFPSVRGIFHRRVRTVKTAVRRYAGPIVVINKVLGFAVILLIQYAIALSSVTVVNALSGLQHVFMFIGIYFLTMCAPGIFREYFTKKELRLEMAGIFLVVIGSVLVVL